MEDRETWRAFRDSEQVETAGTKVSIRSTRRVSFPFELAGITSTTTTTTTPSRTKMCKRKFSNGTKPRPNSEGEGGGWLADINAFHLRSVEYRSAMVSSRATEFIRARGITTAFPRDIIRPRAFVQEQIKSKDTGEGVCVCNFSRRQRSGRLGRSRRLQVYRRPPLPICSWIYLRYRRLEVDLACRWNSR